VLLPAAWTDLPRTTIAESKPVTGLAASPAGWRRFALVLLGVKERRPPAARAKVTIMLARLLAAVIEEARDE
jgi:hypothetical protein